MITHTYIAVYELLTDVELNQTCPPGIITSECAYTVSSVELARKVTAWYWALLDAGSAQAWSSCFTHLFCTDGSSTSLLSLCLQIDEGGRRRR